MITPKDLIDDLRSRINPAYAMQRGTESYERRLCVEALEAQAGEIETLRRLNLALTKNAMSRTKDCPSCYTWAENERLRIEAASKTPNAQSEGADAASSRTLPLD